MTVGHRCRGLGGCPPSVAVPRWIVMPYRGWKGQTFASTHGRLQVLPEQQSAGLRALTASVYPRVGFDWCGGRRLTTAKAARSGLPASHPCHCPWPKVSPVHTVHPVAVVAPPGLRLRSRLHAYSASRNPALLGRESAVGLAANGASSSPETPGPSCQNLRASSACPSVKVYGNGAPNRRAQPDPPQSQGSPSPQQQRRQGASLPE